MATIVSHLVQSSLQASSLPVYRRAWSLFYSFFHSTFPGVHVNIPIATPHLALFIAFLFDRNYASSTVSTYLSAIGYSHKLFGYGDPSKIFFISQMLKGYGKLNSNIDSRLPITRPILHKLLNVSDVMIKSKYELCLFRAMCSLAFHAFLRVGEMTITNSFNHATLTVDNINKLVNTDNHVVSIKVTFVRYKHSCNQPPFSLIISRHSCFCPVQYLLDYLSLRGPAPGALFILKGHPVTRQYFCSLLSTAIRLSGLNPSRYKGHSFRIGAASDAAERGLSDSQIRTLGRWKSNAFLRYIRLSTVHTPH